MIIVVEADGSRLELYAAVCRDARTEGLPIRELAVRHQAH
jgi:hypothetical protein